MLDQVLLLIPEAEHMRAKMKQWEEDKESLRQSLEFTQAEVKELKSQVKSTTEEVGVTNKKLYKLDQLECQIIKQECYKHRSNDQFFGIKDSKDKSPSGTERKLIQFLKKEMQMPNNDLEEMQFERVHSILTHFIAGKSTNKKEQARPIIAKVSFFKDKELIKSYIKNLPKGRRYGVADDFPNEVEEIRKALYPLLKKAKQDKKKAFFNIEKLVIDNVIYHGPESKKFPLYGRIMANG